DTQSEMKTLGITFDKGKKEEEEEEDPDKDKGKTKSKEEPNPLDHEFKEEDK
ncbi:unnamed protein product, partial [marine sediment metagenome]